jgi:hypothetical protein
MTAKKALKKAKTTSKAKPVVKSPVKLKKAMH